MEVSRKVLVRESHAVQQAGKTHSCLVLHDTKQVAGSAVDSLISHRNSDTHTHLLGSNLVQINARVSQRFLFTLDGCLNASHHRPINITNYTRFYRNTYLVEDKAHFKRWQNILDGQRNHTARSNVGQFHAGTPFTLHHNKFTLAALGHGSTHRFTEQRLLSLLHLRSLLHQVHHVEVSGNFTAYLVEVILQLLVPHIFLSRKFTLFSLSLVSNGIHAHVDGFTLGKHIVSLSDQLLYTLLKLFHINSN